MQPPRHSLFADKGEGWAGRPWPTWMAIGVDAGGKEGEIHTGVTAGPLFSSPLHLRHGAVVGHGGYSFLEVAQVS